MAPMMRMPFELRRLPGIVLQLGGVLQLRVVNDMRKFLRLSLAR